MYKQYVFSEREVSEAKDRLQEMKRISLLCRNAADMEGNREWYLRARGFEEALQMLGLFERPSQNRRGTQDWTK